MNNRKIFSPYYDFKSYLNMAPTEEPSKQRKKVATAEEKCCHQGSPKAEKKLKRNASEKGFGDMKSEIAVDRKESLLDFSDYHNLDSANKSCRASFLTNRKIGSQRMSSQSFFHSNQAMNKT